MKGFHLNEDGSVANLALDYEPEVKSFDEGGKETTVKVPQPKNTYYFKDGAEFKKVLAQMQAAPENRFNPVFDGKGGYKMVADKSQAVLDQIKLNNANADRRAEILVS